MVLAFLYLLIAAAAIACFVLIGALRFLIVAGCFVLFSCILIGYRRTCRRKGVPPARAVTVVSVIVPLLVSAILLVFMGPFALRSEQTWRFPYQKTYLALNKSYPAWFPETLSDGVSDYELDFITSFMQGTGHTTLYFVTSPEAASELRARVEERAVYSMPLPETRSSQVTIPEDARRPFKNDPDDWDGSGDFWCRWEYWYPDGYADPDSVVYYLAARGNWNHPASSVVILNEKTGAVEYSQFGWTDIKQQSEPLD